ncbi:MAG: hypothetical protein ACTH9D_06600 [Enterococcus viikkiensis]
MTLIKLYELAYIQRAYFLEQLLGCGQQIIAEEGLDRFKFYLERQAARITYDYYVIPYIKEDSPQ